MNNPFAPLTCLVGVSIRRRNKITMTAGRISCIPPVYITDCCCKELLPPSPAALAVSALLLMAVDTILVQEAYKKRANK
jgi:hypothetical protein